MRVMVTLTVQKEIEAATERGLQGKRDRLIQSLEKKGFSVNVESEDGAEDYDDEDHFSMGSAL
jgi:hypothetical protein